MSDLLEMPESGPCIESIRYFKDEYRKYTRESMVRTLDKQTKHN